MTYSSADVEAKANAHDVNLIVVGGRSMTTMMRDWTAVRIAVRHWHGVVGEVAHGNRGPTSHTWLFDVAARDVLPNWFDCIVTVGFKLDAEVVL